MILVVDDYDGLYGRFWGELGEVTRDPALLFQAPEGVELVCFTGGEDVSPSIYGHKNLDSHCNQARDDREVLIFQMASKHEIPMTAICRGSQFLNVMCGGTMVQHLETNHGGNLHACRTFDGMKFEVTSSHHQMSVLGPAGVYLGWSSSSLPAKACVYDGDICKQNLLWLPPGAADRAFRVTEAFAYPKKRIFAVQHHPEWQKINEEAPQWTLQKIREICLSKEERTLVVS
jgi:gamma-glutamyl-gamma-aminobutyrate hydrolase PuuD